MEDETQLQQHAKKIAIPLMEHSDKDESEVARLIAAQLDKDFGPTWFVIVGQDFSAAYTAETKRVTQFCIGKVSFLLYKAG